MKKFLLSLFAIISTFFIIQNVNAEVVKVNLSEFKFNNINLLDLSYYYIPEGNRSMYFDYDFSSVDENATILYNSVVICSDAKYTSAYASDPSEVSNIRMNNTSYNCSYHNSSYTGGKVVIITFVTYSSGANSIVLYQNGNASVQLIDFVVDSSGYVNPMNYSSQSLINQNSQIINQNNTIINNQNDIKNNTEDIKGALNDDSIDTSQSDSFFDGFNNEDNLLTSVVLFPIQILNNVDSTCTPLTLPFESDKMKANDYSLPCGDTLFWNKPKVAEFKKFWNFIVGAPIIYGCLLWSFKTIQKLKNPFDNEVEMIEL